MLSMQPWIKGWMKEGRREGKTDYQSSLCVYLTWGGGGMCLFLGALCSMWDLRSPTGLNL